MASVTWKLSFMDIPPEIRVKIYRALLIHDVPIDSEFITKRRGYPRPELSAQLLRLNKIICEEAKPILYGENDFDVNRGLALRHLCNALTPKTLNLFTKFSGLDPVLINKIRVKTLQRFKGLETIELSTGRIHIRGNASKDLEVEHNSRIWKVTTNAFIGTISRNEYILHLNRFRLLLKIEVWVRSQTAFLQAMVWFEVVWSKSEGKSKSKSKKKPVEKPWKLQIVRVDKIGPDIDFEE